jgi:ABC-type transporter Mla maintaining outer membrane lipid asymmetry ATPase subunit MlaF
MTNQKKDCVDDLAILPAVNAAELLSELTEFVGRNALGLQVNSLRAAVAELIEAASLQQADKYPCDCSGCVRLRAAIARAQGGA